MIFSIPPIIYYNGGSMLFFLVVEEESGSLTHHLPAGLSTHCFFVSVCVLGAVLVVGLSQSVQGECWLFVSFKS